MMIITGRSGATKPVAPFFQERFAQRVQTRIENRLDRLRNQFPVCLLPGSQLQWTLQQFVFFLLGERAPCPFARFESVLLVPVTLTAELDKILARERATGFIVRVIAPIAQPPPI